MGNRDYKLNIYLADSCSILHSTLKSNWVHPLSALKSAAFIVLMEWVDNYQFSQSKRKINPFKTIVNVKSSSSFLKINHQIAHFRL